MPTTSSVASADCAGSLEQELIAEYEDIPVCEAEVEVGTQCCFGA